MKKKVSMIIGKLSVLNWSGFKIAANVRGLCVRAGFEKPNFNLSTDDK